MEIKLDRYQYRVVKTYLWILGIGGAYFLWIQFAGKGLACMIYSSTGLLCPGCGCTRMFLALARLDFRAAIGHNAAAFGLLLLWNLIGVAVFCGKPAFLRKTTFLYGTLAVSIALLIVFGIVRNL